MPLKRILVHLESSKDCENRLKFAADIARYFQAEVHGIWLLPPVQVNELGVDLSIAMATGLPMEAGMDVALGSQLSEQEATIRDDIEAIIKQTITEDINFHWEIARQGAEYFAENSCYHDLAVVSGNNNLEFETPLLKQWQTSDKLALNSPCPVLVLPEGEFRFPVKNPVIIWNASKETARAVADAIPLFWKHVELTIYNASDERVIGEKPQLNQKSLFRYLNLHGVDVAASNLIEADDVSSINQQVNKNNHDLIVMGAFGHSRVHDLLTGSKTRELIRNAKVPVLLSN